MNSPVADPKFTLSQDWWKSGMNHTTKTARDLLESVNADTADSLEEQAAIIKAYYDDNPAKFSAIPPQVHAELVDLGLLAA
jgi:hypothetical protein